jgi:hypothetical protein
MMESLEGKAAKDPAAPNVPHGVPETPAERPGAAPAEIPPASSPEASPTPEASPEGAPETPGAPSPGSEGQPAAEAGKGKKVSPWKLVDEYKGKLAKAEKELADTRSSIVPEAERGKLTERVTKAEARAAELEEHIRYVDYTKSTEFQTKFHAPYEQAFKRAMSDLKDLSVPAGENGATRPFGAEDLLQLVNMERGQARKVAEELFGADAQDVLAARLECRRLWDERSAGLEEAKKSGSERVANAQKAYRDAQQTLAKTIKDTWDTVNAALVNDPQIGEFFKPREGDAEWNQRLAKGFELVDKAFSENPSDSRLTPEERAAVVRRHAALRNRAASWGALRHALTKVKAELAAARKQLDGYKSSSPPAGGSTPQSGSIPAGPGAKKDRLLASLDRIVHH